MSNWLLALYCAVLLLNSVYKCSGRRVGRCIIGGMENKSAIVVHVNNPAYIGIIIKCRQRVESFSVCCCLNMLALLAYAHFPLVLCSTACLEAQGKNSV